MKKLNNNILKAELIKFAIKNGNFIEYKELDINLSTCNFKIVLLTNNKIKHVLIFNYHCKLLDYKIKNLNKNEGLSDLTFTSFNAPTKLISKAKDIYQATL